MRIGSDRSGKWVKNNRGSDVARMWLGCEPEHDHKDPTIAAFFRNTGFADELGPGTRKLYRYPMLTQCLPNASAVLPPFFHRSSAMSTRGADGPKIAYPMFNYPYYSFISDEIGLISVTLIGATGCGTVGILTPSAVRMRP
ncbi:MAG: hypothetical protein FWD37_03385 [Methanomassiliicoccaceae archaeon]|nr:hypothetical protein [Methanomassiliicoccaceae archaeon]